MRPCVRLSLIAFLATGLLDGSLRTAQPALATSRAQSAEVTSVSILRCRLWLRANAFQIRYRVDGARTATAVSFDVTRGDASTTLITTGRFSPGVTIDRFFPVDGRLRNASKLQCRVDDVTFAGDAG